MSSVDSVVHSKKRCMVRLWLYYVKISVCHIIIVCNLYTIYIMF